MTDCKDEPKTLASDLIRQEADLLATGVAMQSEGLKVLLAEVQGLAFFLAHGPTSPAPDPKTDNEIEDSFDNMPI